MFTPEEGGIVNILDTLRRETPRSETNLSDNLLPSQFWGAHGTSSIQPEKRLLAAVLEEAISILLSGSRVRSSEQLQEARDAAAWFASDDRSGAFSFASICDVFALDTTSVREAVGRMKDGESTFVRPRSSAGRGRHRIRERRRRSRSAA